MTTQTNSPRAAGVGRVLVTGVAATLLLTGVLTGILASTAGAAGPPYCQQDHSHVVGEPLGQRPAG